MIDHDRLSLLLCWLSSIALFLVERRIDAWVMRNVPRYAARPWAWLYSAAFSAIQAIIWRHAATLAWTIREDAFLWWLWTVCSVAFVALMASELVFAALVFWCFYMRGDDVRVIGDEGNLYRSLGE